MLDKKEKERILYDKVKFHNKDKYFSKKQNIDIDFWNGFGLKVLCTAIFLLLIIASFSITKTDENYSPVQSTQEQQDSSNEYTDNNANNTPSEENKSITKEGNTPESSTNSVSTTNIPTPEKRLSKEKNQSTSDVEPKNHVVKEKIPKVIRKNTQTPEEYLNSVKEHLNSRRGESIYSMDCTLLVDPHLGIKILKDEWNGDAAYNFIHEVRVPPYYDENGEATPIIIRFDGHSITSVKFQNQQ